ncbi:MAG: phosphotransferase [Solirubrobacterales bacterium]|nr:phosphotransferase [Solirubrobacterales bacterium]
MDDLDEVIARAQADLGPPEGEPVAMEGGITNRNFRMRFGATDYVLRLCSKDTEVLGIDRVAELAATRAAHAAGVAPAVALFLPEHACLITRFVEGRNVDASELRVPAVMAQVAASIRAVHEGPRFPAAFSAFRSVESCRDETLRRGGTVPPEYDVAAALADRIEAALTGPEHEPVPCHNDLLTANFIAAGAPDPRIVIVDWEYAGMGDRFFDLGNLSTNNAFSDADDAVLLSAYFGEPAAGPAFEAHFAALRLMRLMSDFREAMWGVVQTVVSELDFDYAAYAAAHFARLRAAASDPRLERWLRDAAP